MEADYGLSCTDAKKINFKNLILKTKKLPVAKFENSSDVTLDGLEFSGADSPVIQISGGRAGKTILKNAGIKSAEKQLTIGKEVPANVVQVVK